MGVLRFDLPELEIFDAILSLQENYYELLQNIKLATPYFLFLLKFSYSTIGT